MNNILIYSVITIIVIIIIAIIIISLVYIFKNDGPTPSSLSNPTCRDECANYYNNCLNDCGPCGNNSPCCDICDTNLDECRRNCKMNL